jgi:hypothetical protein
MARNIQAAFAEVQKRLTQPPPMPGFEAFRGPKKRTGPKVEQASIAPEGRPTVGERIELMPKTASKRPWWQEASAHLGSTGRSAKIRKKV